MKPIRNALLAVGMSFAFAAPIHAAENGGTATVDKNYAHSVWDWEKMGEAHIFWTLYGTDGYLTVCGGYTTKGPSATRKFTRIALRDTAVFMNGTSIITNLNWLTTLKGSGSNPDVIGQQVKCKVTTTPIPAKGDDVQFELRSRKDTYRG